jgi:hypothetical protein
MENIFERLYDLKSSPEHEAISFIIGTAGDLQVQINVALNFAPVLVAALIAEAGKLAKSLPEDRQDMYQVITPSNVTASIADGAACLLFDLPSGLALPIVMDAQYLIGLRAELDLLIGPASERPN